ncbi:hypothetical protein SPRG_11353 [Saprolegnia parasitica CBS 223.65]|uniref:Uncharacterized protein n=1 Tax=Saprolegnia parasitica (strain CBS 223.65) TaxID=695850 RepID=A0A067C776_SAPPC|nr:hypothetical protein SPRG_11353 [Saprolegnia parasitica CBS 223.65]KDO22401.1 hypothetical protein SPRG_11353 [Saprolegnia parasitica CBS 223.65]|eukprot:XP_012206924.1 hypothetical protein SPRG_11353 [Saprolegnia parasitica CBS 223.65]
MGTPDETKGHGPEHEDNQAEEEHVKDEEHVVDGSEASALQRIRPDETYTGAQLALLIQQAQLEAEHKWKKKMADVMESHRHVQIELVNVQTERELLLQTHEATKTALQKLMQFEDEKAAATSDTTAREALVAALEVERTARETLANECLQLREKRLQLTRRIAVLEHQIVKYQQTETVLAQSISHFQHRVDAKEHQRAEDMERLKDEIGDATRAEVDTIKAEYQSVLSALTLVQSDVKKYQEENERLTTELEDVKQNIHNDEAMTEGLRARVKQLETEKAVLQSKAEQLQKADASLRYRLNAAEHRAKELQAEIDVLKTQDTHTLKRRVDELEAKQDELLMENAQLQETTLLSTRLLRTSFNWPKRERWKSRR